MRLSLSFYSTSSSRKSLVRTRIEPVVYVHSRHLQLRGDATIPIITFSFLQALSPNSNKILILMTCILNRSICFNMVGTHILVLKLQLITFNLLWYYKGLISSCSPAMFTFACKLGCRLDSMVLKWKFEHGSNTILRNSKANRTVSQGCHGLMHLLTHEHNTMKAGENKPLTVSKQWRFWSRKMQQGLLFCFSSRVRPLEWWYKQWPGCCHLRDQDEERHIFNLYALYIRWAVTADNY